jgi:outer membrane protein OmpA-like peptidoglycan-associated protein
MSSAWTPGGPRRAAHAGPLLRSLRLLLVAALMPAAVAGCTGTPPAAGSATGSPTRPAVAQTRQVQIGGATMTLTVEPLVRSGDAVVLTVRVRLDQTPTRGPAAPGWYFQGNVLSPGFYVPRLVDVRNRRAYRVPQTNGGDDCVCTTDYRYIPEGGSDVLQAAFAGVPAGITALDVMLPMAGDFADVPIRSGAVPAPPSASAGPARKPLDLTKLGAPLASDLDLESARLDLPLRTDQQQQDVRLTLSADVLFAVDSAALSAASTATLSAAAGQVRAAGPGALLITGYTDNTGTSAHNLVLSQQRAQSVAAALTPLLATDRWPQTVAGKGETEPLVPNTSDANRQLNRRVTISFRATQTGTPPPAATPATAVPLPATKGALGTAPDGVQVTTARPATVHVVPRQVRVRDGLLLVELGVRNDGTNTVQVPELLGPVGGMAPGHPAQEGWFGATGVRVFQGDTVYYPAYHELDHGGADCLCDGFIGFDVAPHQEFLATVWFPLPANPTAPFVLDVPDVLRISGVTA